MEPICGIPADTLREVARGFARAESAIIFWGMGVSQHTHGTDNARCLIALSLICGQVGRPGTGLHPLRGQNNVQGASDAGLIPMFFPDYKSVESPEMIAKYERAWAKSSIPSAAKPWSRSWTRCMPTRSRACTSWAKTPRCRTPI
jgi:formate dehydrogenase major subunit